MSTFIAQPLDAIALKHLAQTLQPKLIGAKVNKIQQTSHHELFIHFWQSKPASTQYKFIISIRPQLSFCGIIPDSQDLKREFPKTPLNFCVLLRKYLTGARVKSCSVLPDERVLIIGFDNYNDTGDTAQYELIIELMGKHSNIILREAELNLILGSAHGVSEEMSRHRTLRVGDPYLPPPEQPGKQPLQSLVSQALFTLLATQPKENWTDLLLKQYSGWGRKTVEEIVENANDADTVFKSIQLLQKQCSPDLINSQNILSGFCLLSNKQNDVNDILTTYYLASLNVLDCTEIKNQLLRELNNTKLQIMKRDKSLQETSNIDYVALKETADNVLTTGAIEHNAKQIATAQKNYQQYKKAKSRYTMAQTEIKKLEDGLESLEELILACEMSTSVAELSQYKLLANELGFLRKQKVKPAPQKTKQNKKTTENTSKTKPLCLTLPDNTRIWVGRTGPENAYLVRHLSQENDWWFHVPHQPGAHVLLQSGITDDTQLEPLKMLAAQCAIYYSRARNEGTSAVLMTQGKNVKSIPGSMAGHVRFKNERSQFVTLNEKDVESLNFA